MATNVFRPVATTNANEALHRREMAERINQLANGKHNATGGPLSLSTGTYTVITDPRVGGFTKVIPCKASANALGVDVWLVSRGDGTFTWGHVTATATDRTFEYVIGG